MQRVPWDLGWPSPCAMSCSTSSRAIVSASRSEVPAATKSEAVSALSSSAGTLVEPSPMAAAEGAG